MPFCPVCRLEYNPDITKCSDCNVWLVEELPDEGVEIEFSEEDWLELARLTSSAYAEMVLEAWRSDNIRGLVQSKVGHFGITGQMGTTTFRPVGGAYSLWVHRDDIVRADRIAEGILGETWTTARLLDIEE